MTCSQQGHAGPVCSLCDNGYARRNGTVLPCSKCPLGQGAGNATILPLIGFTGLAFGIILIFFLIYLSWPDGEYQKKQDEIEQDLESMTNSGGGEVEDASQKEITHKDDGEEEEEEEKEEEDNVTEDGGEVKIIVDLVKEEMVGRAKDRVIGKLVDATGDSSGEIDNADANQKQKIKKKADKRSKQQINTTKGAGAIIVGHIKIIAGWIQIMSSLTTTFSVPWVSSSSSCCRTSMFFKTFFSLLRLFFVFLLKPPLFLEFLSFPPFKLLNVDLMGILTLLSPCDLGHVPFTQKFIAHMSILPIMAIVMTLASVVALKLRKCFCQRRFQSTSAKQRVRASLAFMVFLLYPGMSVKIFQMFKCREFDQKEWYLVADLSIRCYQGMHAVFLLVAVVCVFVFVIGIPLLVFLLLHCNRSALYDPSHKDHTSMVRQYGSMFSGYEPEFFYWETLEMLKKCALTGGLGKFSSFVNSAFIINIVFFVLKINCINARSYCYFISVSCPYCYCVPCFFN